MLKKFVEKNLIGVVTDMKSRGVLSESENASLGYIGFNNDLRALKVFDCRSPIAAEQIISVGISKDLINLYLNAEVVEIIKIEPCEINSFFETYTSSQDIIDQRKYWLNELNKLGGLKASRTNFKNKVSYVDLIRTLNDVMPKSTIYCLDSGQIRRAGSIFLTSYLPRTLLHSDTLSPMGLGICSSIGAQLAKPDRHVVCLFGDGSMRMNGIELSTAVRYDLPIIFMPVLKYLRLQNNYQILIGVNMEVLLEYNHFLLIVVRRFLKN